MNRKISYILVLCLIMAALITACAQPAPSPSPSLTPVPTPTMSPAITTSPTAPMTTNPSMTGTTSSMNEEAARDIEAEVDKLSEVEKTSAAVMGSEAIVAIEYTAQYQGGLTDRVKQMVEEKVKAADSSIDKIVITDDPAQFTKVDELKTRTGEEASRDFRALLSEVDRAA